VRSSSRCKWARIMMMWTRTRSSSNGSLEAAGPGLESPRDYRVTITESTRNASLSPADLTRTLQPAGPSRRPSRPGPPAGRGRRGRDGIVRDSNFKLDHCASDASHSARATDPPADFDLSTGAAAAGVVLARARQCQLSRSRRPRRPAGPAGGRDREPFK
jgi:hypothetical protein